MIENNVYTLKIDESSKILYRLYLLMSESCLRIILSAMVAVSRYAYGTKPFWMVITAMKSAQASIPFTITYISCGAVKKRLHGYAPISLGDATLPTRRAAT
jgi:hypothetical protein